MDERGKDGRQGGRGTARRTNGDNTRAAEGAARRTGVSKRSKRWAFARYTAQKNQSAVGGGTNE